MIQAAAGEPLTVYGKGGQTRGFLDIRDTGCVELAIRHPARAGEFRVYQPIHRVLLGRSAGGEGLRRRGGAEIVHLDDPRVELEEHYYRAAHTKLLDLGLLPFLLGDELLADLVSIAGPISVGSNGAPWSQRCMWRSTSSDDRPHDAVPSGRVHFEAPRLTL